MQVLTPREIVSELDRYIVGQTEAKRMVAVAMRNRWRRSRIEPELRDEIAPKNIIMMGPTGVGKTEIARRLARLAASPFLKVEATKFTEVGYVGRDVESIVRDLMEIGVNLVRGEENERVRAKAEVLAEERLMDLLLPPSGARRGDGPGAPGDADAPRSSVSLGSVFAAGPDGVITEPARDIREVDGRGRAREADGPDSGSDSGYSGLSTREKLRRLWREGRLDAREVEIEVAAQGPQLEVMAMPGMGDMQMQFQDLFNKIAPGRKKKRRIHVPEAYEILLAQEAERLIDMDKVVEQARERVQESGIVFIDELDKVVSSAHDGGKTADVSREGVQRDLLPIVEGSVVNTKYGMVSTEHILFIAAGAFHYAKPSDLIPELQGRFPLRVELGPLAAEEFYRILTEPDNALTVQYTALLATEGVGLSFTDDALREVASFAERTNQETENIGARRLYTILEHILADLSFDAPDLEAERRTVVVDAQYVREKLKDVWEDRDLSRYIL